DSKRRSVFDELMTLTQQTVVYGVSVSIDLKQFEALWPENHPYIFCTSQCVSLIADWCREHKIREKILYIYDNGDERGPQFREAMSDVLSLGERYRDMFNARTIAPGSSKNWPGLDAVDCLAWAGGHYPGYYYGRVSGLNRTLFWRLKDSDLANAVTVIQSQTTEEFPELKRIAKKWGISQNEV